jgi:hypothetical protein
MVGVFVALERQSGWGSNANDTRKTSRVYRPIAALHIQAITITTAVSRAAGQAITSAISAFCAWRRFSASSQAAEPGPCSTSCVISSP